MRNRIALALLWVMLAPGLAASSQTMSFTTSDGERIDGDLYSAARPASAIAIVAPGFAQHRHTQVMKALCGDLSNNPAKTMDSFCLDFRGTGTSTGDYTFGANEQLDLEPILQWAAAHYEKVNLIGLSLGAYTAGRAAYLWPKNVSKLLLISCPTSVNEIVTSGGVFDSFFSSIVDPDLPELQTGADWFFHWGDVFGDKPDLSDLGPQIFTPASFLIGQNDHLVFESLSRKSTTRLRVRDPGTCSNSAGTPKRCSFRMHRCLRTGLRPISKRAQLTDPLLDQTLVSLIECGELRTVGMRILFQILGLDLGVKIAEISSARLRIAKDGVLGRDLPEIAVAHHDTAVVEFYGGFFAHLRDRLKRQVDRREVQDRPIFFRIF